MWNLIKVSFPPTASCFSSKCEDCGGVNNLKENGGCLKVARFGFY
jgi:hypothetical protein